MDNLPKQSLLTLFKEIKILMDKCLKSQLNCGDFTIPQTMIIYNLAHSRKMKIGELSERLGLTNSTISGIVDRLEDQGIVTRQRSTVDRRVVYVELSPEHSKMYSLDDELDQYLADIISEIPPDQMHSIMEGLTILKRTFTKHLNHD